MRYVLKPGDMVQIIAPAGKTPEPQQDVEKVLELLKTWGLVGRASSLIWGENKDYPELSNTDAKRFEDLKNALVDPQVKAIWCIRGGYGTLRLFSDLKKYFPVPPAEKLFIGFSDITLLHLYFNQVWGWQTIHGPVAIQAVNNKLAPADLENLRKIIFGEVQEILINDLTPLNHAAKMSLTLSGQMTGGNLTVISRLFGTPYQIKTQHKILVLEDVEEPFRKIDGMLQQFILTGLLEPHNKPAAVILGDFSNANAEQLQAIENCLHEFAEKLTAENIPVLRCLGIGHGQQNHPFIEGGVGELQLGEVSSQLLQS